MYIFYVWRNAVALMFYRPQFKWKIVPGDGDAVWLGNSGVPTVNERLMTDALFNFMFGSCRHVIFFCHFPSFRFGRPNKTLLYFFAFTASAKHMPALWHEQALEHMTANTAHNIIEKLRMLDIRRNQIQKLNSPKNFRIYVPKFVSIGNSVRICIAFSLRYFEAIECTSETHHSVVFLSSVPILDKTVFDQMNRLCNNISLHKQRSIKKVERFGFFRSGLHKSQSAFVIGM